MASDSSDDEGVFIGPVTLKERKWHLTKKYYHPTSFTRHTLGPIALEKNESSSSSLSYSQDTNEKHVVQDGLVISDLEESIVCNFNSETSNENILNEITTITISDDDEDVCEYQLKPHNVSLEQEVQKDNCSPDILQVATNLQKIEKDACMGDFSYQNESSEYDNAFGDNLEIFGEQHECKSPSQTSDTQSFTQANVVSSVDDHFGYDAYLNDSHESASTQTTYEQDMINNDGNSDEYTRKITTENKENLPKLKTKSKPGKYDYLVSTVGRYIREKPMGPPATPASLKKTTKTKILVPKQSISAQKQYKDVMSPLAVYIKSAPTTPLIKRITPKALKSEFSVEEQILHSPNTILDESLPKVSYKPAKNKIVSKAAGINLPGSVRKLYSQNVQVISHKDRIRDSSQDVSLALENAEQSCLSNTSVASNDISVLSVKNVYIK